MSSSTKWAEFKFSVIGHLLASPPLYGQLRMRLKELSEKKWKHPINGEFYSPSIKTVEAWYYKATKASQMPMEELRPKKRSDFNTHKAITDWMKIKLGEEVQKHPGWSKQLHADNLKIIIERDNMGQAPSYSTVKKYLSKVGYLKISSRSSKRDGFKKSFNQKQKFEQRSYEHPYVGSLFHLDFHHCSREIITESGEIIFPLLFCVIDDNSRLVCHIQWYLSENAENLIHGFIQGLQKRGLPRALMSDNGKAMTSNEFTSGLKSLSILHETTLPYSPEQNGKQEVFWAQVEGRLMSMIESKKVVTLKELNHMTQAWAEMEYNKKIHSETKSTPLKRYLSGTSVLRPCPSSEILKKSFRRTEKRKVRRSDGTISLSGKRFEIPQSYRHLLEISVQYCFWDLSNVDLSCCETGKVLCRIFPINKNKNSNAQRRSVKPLTQIIDSDEVAPIMDELLKKYSETGLPPAYQPKDEQ